MGATQVVDTQQVLSHGDGERVDVDLAVVPEEPGDYLLYVDVAPQEGELVTDNNSQLAFLRVREGGLRVLYLESNYVSPESKFLQRAWSSSQDIEVEEVILDRGKRGEWPVVIPESVRRTQYDVYVLGDVDSDAFDSETMQWLADRIGRGAGFLALGGYHTMGPGGYAQTVLADLFPIEMDRRNLERQRLESTAPIRSDIMLPGPLRMVPRRSHPILDLGEGKDRQAAWGALPPLTDALRWIGVREPAGQVLASSEQGDPLLVQGRFRDGLTLAFAGSSTWRWVRQGAGDFHHRFWRQVILFLARREMAPQRRLEVDLPRRRIGRRQPLPLQITWRTEAQTGSDVVDRPSPPLHVSVTDPTGVESVWPVTEQQGDGELLQWSAEIAGHEVPGLYQLRVTAAAGSPAEENRTLPFLVMQRDLELEDPAASPQHLARLAQATEAVGGELVAPEELSRAVARLLAHDPKERTEVVERWQLGDRAASAWGAFGLTTLLLLIEWYLRKRWGMV